MPRVHIAPLLHDRPQEPPNIAGRRFDGLKLPHGYGALLLGGGTSAVVVLDGRAARFAVGENGALCDAGLICRWG